MNAKRSLPILVVLLCLLLVGCRQATVHSTEPSIAPIQPATSSSAVPSVTETATRTSEQSQPATAPMPAPKETSRMNLPPAETFSDMSLVRRICGSYLISDPPMPPGEEARLEINYVAGHLIFEHQMIHSGELIAGSARELVLVDPKILLDEDAESFQAHVRNFAFVGNPRPASEDYLDGEVVFVTLGGSELLLQYGEGYEYLYVKAPSAVGMHVLDGEVQSRIDSWANEEVEELWGSWESVSDQEQSYASFGEDGTIALWHQTSRETPTLYRGIYRVDKNSTMRVYLETIGEGRENYDIDLTYRLTGDRLELFPISGLPDLPQEMILSRKPSDEWWASRFVPKRNARAYTFNPNDVFGYWEVVDVLENGESVMTAVGPVNSHLLIRGSDDGTPRANFIYEDNKREIAGTNALLNFTHRMLYEGCPNPDWYYELEAGDPNTSKMLTVIDEDTMILLLMNPEGPTQIHYRRASYLKR